MRETLEISHINENLFFKENFCFQSRGKSVISMVQKAFKYLNKQEKRRLKNFKDTFFLGDEAGAGYSFCSENYHDKIIPCFLFNKWPEVGINNYDELCDKMLLTSLTPYKIKKLFWIGNIHTNHQRKYFFESFKSYKDIIDVKHFNPMNSRDPLNDNFISLESHLDYKYLIDIEGKGFSGRLKVLLFSGRPIFIQERKCNEYYFFDLQPFVHYIPIKSNFEDLLEKIDWAEDNQEKCKEIARNAQRFALTNLRRINAVRRYEKILLNMGS